MIPVSLLESEMGVWNCQATCRHQETPIFTSIIYGLLFLFFFKSSVKVWVRRGQDNVACEVRRHRRKPDRNVQLVPGAPNVDEQHERLDIGGQQRRCLTALRKRHEPRLASWTGLAPMQILILKFFAWEGLMLFETLTKSSFLFNDNYQRVRSWLRLQRRTWATFRRT